jgi:MYXO-CTERM domain-containing protein
MRKALALVVLVASAARADGAFPTGMSVLLPAGAPQRILLGTTFGLVLSDDAGATFRYVCEPYVTASGATVLIYQAASNGGVVAAHQDALSVSTDLGCSWTRAAGLAPGLVVIDAFIDPSNPSSVLAIAWPPAAGASLFPSADGGRSFGPALLTSGTAPVHADERLVSVEIAASAPVIYATTFAFPTASSPAGGAALLRSADGGTSWTRLEMGMGPSVQVKIAQVDPADANTVYLLVSAGGSDEIRVAADGGATVLPLLAPGVPIGGFVRASDGTLYAGTSAGDFYVRRPGAGPSFERFRGPHLRCLGERAGRVYACGDSTADGYDLATSDDHGQSFQKLLGFTQLLGPATCPAVQSACGADFAALQRALEVVPSGSCSCGQPSGDAAALLILLAAALRRRRRAPAQGRR